MWIAFLIWTLTAFAFLAIAISSWRSKEATGFFTGVKPPKVKDVKAYNHAVAKLWFVFTIIYEIMGIPLLYSEENTFYAIIVSLLLMFLVIGCIVAYLFIENKYKEK